MAGSSTESATPRVHLDYETRSTVDLKKTGASVYAEHPSTHVWLARFRFEGDSEIGEWIAGQPYPQRLIDHVAAGNIVVAHNAGFEWLCWNVILPRQLGVALPPLTFEQMECTMARAFCLGLPPTLEMAAQVVGAKVQKDMAGSAKMKRMAKPRKINDDGSVVWWDSDEDVAGLSAYCADDVAAEEGVDDAVPALTPDDRATWLMDQHMNQRGILLDAVLIEAMNDAVTSEKNRLDKEMAHLTGGWVAKCSKRADLLAWLADNGVDISSLSKKESKEVDEAIAALRLNDDTVSTVVRLYRQANKSSTAKLKRMLQTVCEDGRSRGTMQCHGAFTGRWSGRLWQPQNLKRMDEDRDGPVVRAAVHALTSLPTAKALEVLHCYTDDVMELVSVCMRSVIIAPSGSKLVGADYSNIEGRVIAWLAGAEKKLEAFREQDAGRGVDLYKLTYASAFGVDIQDVTKLLRQIGKTLVLSAQYQGSVGALMNMAGNLGVDVFEMARIALDVSPLDVIDKARFAHKQPGSNHFELPEDTWIGLKIVISQWRASPLDSPLVQFWWDLQDAALAAVTSPGEVVYVGKTGRIAYVCNDGALICRLPTGKCLVYSNPRVRVKETERQREDGTTYIQTSNSVEYDGWDGMTRRWGTIHLYGGLQANHVTQGTAAEIMKRGMKNLEAGRPLWGASPLPPGEGFPPILTVHDEAVAEVPDSLIDKLGEDAVVKRFENLMLAVGSEFEGLPLAASGWCDQRYVK